MSLTRPNTIITPEEYRINQARLAQARAYLDECDKRNEEGKQKHDEIARQLEAKVREGEDARRLLETLQGRQQEEILSTAIAPVPVQIAPSIVLESPPTSTSRIEEVSEHGHSLQSQHTDPPNPQYTTNSNRSRYPQQPVPSNGYSQAGHHSLQHSIPQAQSNAPTSSSQPVSTQFVQKQTEVQHQYGQQQQPQTVQYSQQQWQQQQRHLEIQFDQQQRFQAQHLQQQRLQPMQQRRYQQPHYEAHQQYQPTQNQFHSGNQANAASYARQTEILQSQLEMEPLRQARHQALMENTSQQERAVPFSNVLQAKATTLAVGAAQKEYQPRFQRSQATAETPQRLQKNSSQGNTTQYTANDTRVLMISNSSSLASALTDNSGAKGDSSHPANQVPRSNRTPSSTTMPATIDPRQLMHPSARRALPAPTPQPQRNSAHNMPATIDPRHLLKSSSDFTIPTTEVQSHAPIPQLQVPINSPELLTQTSPALNSSSIRISSSASDSKAAQRESIRPKTSASSLAFNGVSASSILPITNAIASESNSVNLKPRTSSPNVNPFMHFTGASPSVLLHAPIPQQQAPIKNPELLTQTPSPALNSSSIGTSSSAGGSKAAQQESMGPKTSALSSASNGVSASNILPNTNTIALGSDSVNPKPRTSSPNVNPYIHLTGASPSAPPRLNANNRISQSSSTKPRIPILPDHIDWLKGIVGVWAATAPPNTFFIMPDTGYKVIKTVNRDIVIEIPNDTGGVTPTSVGDFVTQRHFYSKEALQLYARRLQNSKMATSVSNGNATASTANTETPVSNGNATVSTFNAETPIKGVVRPTTEVNKKHLAMDVLRALGFKRLREDELSSKPVEQPSAKRQASGEGIHALISTSNIQAVSEWKRASSSVIMKTEQRAPVADQPISTSHSAMDTRPDSTLRMMQPLQSAPSVNAGAQSLSTSMIDTTISTGDIMASKSKPTAATERTSGSGVATSTAHLPPSTSTSKAGSSSASPFTAVTADLGRTVTPPLVEVLAVNNDDNADEREVEDMVDQLSPITGTSILPPPQPMSFSSQYSPVKKVPQTPLFLPSPSSSLPPLDPGSIGGSSTRVSVVPSKGKGVAMGRLPALGKKGKKRQRAYVLIPPSPEYVTKYKAHLMTLELKGSRKTLRQGESRQGSTPQSVGRSVSRDIVSRPQSPIHFANDDEERHAVKLACTRLRVAECKWDGCDVVMNSVHGLIEHLYAQHQPPDRRLKKTYLCLWQHCARVCKAGDAHVDMHAILPLHCPYEGCEEKFRRASQLVKHEQMEHKEDALRKAWDALTFIPDPGPVPPLPKILPSYRVVNHPVRQAPISEVRHAILGPWVLQNISGPLHLKAERYNAAAKPGGANKRRQEVDEEGSNEYEFLKPGSSSTHYSWIQSEPASIRTRDMEPLDSAEISELVHFGLQLWNDIPEEDDGIEEWDALPTETPPSLSARDEQGERVGPSDNGELNNIAEDEAGQAKHPELLDEHLLQVL